MKAKYVVACCAVCLAAGFFSGRRTVSYKEVVTYRTGERYDMNFELPKPKAIKFSGDFNFSGLVIPEDAVFPEDIDLRPTAYDWNLERRYTENIDREYGNLTIDATVQYNMLRELNTSFVPVYKEIVRYREKVWQPFASASYSTFGYSGIGGGVFYRNWGIEYQYQRHFPLNANGHLFGVKYKF
jgi:hypothetical protein